MLLRYLNITASNTNPITTFTRASQPPLRGSFFKYDGNAARKKNGDASPVAKLAIPTTGCVMLWLVTEDASNGRQSGPTHAKDVSENVRPISRRAKYPPRRDAWSIFVSMPEGRVIFERPQQAERERREHGGDESVDLRV